MFKIRKFFQYRSLIIRSYSSISTTDVIICEVGQRDGLQNEKVLNNLLTDNEMINEKLNQALDFLSEIKKFNRYFFVIANWNGFFG